MTDMKNACGGDVIDESNINLDVGSGGAGACVANEVQLQQMPASPRRHPLAAGTLFWRCPPRECAAHLFSGAFAMSSIATAASHRPGRLARAARRVARLLRMLELALQVRHERRLLLAMDDRTLKDLGLHGVAYGEATRPLWDLPLDRRSAFQSPARDESMIAQRLHPSAGRRTES